MATAGRSLRFVEATPDGRGYLVQVEGGPHDRTLVFVPGPPPRHLLEAQLTGDRYVAPAVDFDDLPPTVQREAQATAERLLLSLLDEEQRADYAATGGFWVELADGSQLRLGTLYHLIHRLPDGPISERVLCVVPADRIGRVPPADLWTNLLLTLLHDPDRFFAVANVLSVTRADATLRGPRFESLRTVELVTLARSHYRAGDWWNGALAEHALARRHLRAGRRREALRCAIPAALTIRACDVAPGPNEAATRDQVQATARRLAPVAWPTPGLIEDLLAVADARMRRFRPDRGEALDQARLQLAAALGPAAKAGT